MEIFVITIGIIISLLSLVFLMTGKKIEEKSVSSDLIDLEFEFRELKNGIEDLIKDFNTSASYNTDLLENKINELKMTLKKMDEKKKDISIFMKTASVFIEEMKVQEDNYSEKLEISKETEENKVEKKDKIEEKVQEKKEIEEKEDIKEEKKYEKLIGEIEKELKDPEEIAKEKDIAIKEKKIKKKTTFILSEIEEEIVKKYQEGKEIKGIAIETGKSIGEIEFILELIGAR